ncbi:extracellular solute-binding protein (plasmid) [Paroceanicella profunda]|uniref:Extracellular solute-binding protein n=1 Tax=Paroceanicella profunda TaxID=2579971 RepID=A0A5B8G3U9_9RHOB|nr:extracellular solute-binding protein [Paroceanicella profunda]QDL94660.1 extracellular solute-binding protein [Paroceanicella profunda]
MTLFRHIRLPLFVATCALTSNAALAEQIRFWTTEEQPERLAKQQALAESFTEATGHTVEIIPVTESDLGKRATAAFAANDLPDVIYTTLQYVQPWAEAGILDIDSDTEIVEDLGADTFAPGALATTDIDGDYAAVPVDGWTQMVVYRKDLFEENGLEPPNSYANIEAAIEKLSNPPEMYGFVAATKIDENSMNQALEHILLANGATPIKADGSVGFDPEKLKEGLEFYKVLAKASPPGDLYWKQSREIYFAGKAAMILWSPYILDELAGLRDSAPPTITSDPTSRELADKTGIVTTLSGPSNPEGATWAEIKYFGVTTSANADAAMEFVEYAMGDGYAQTLSVGPEGQFPVRRGTEDDPEKFVKEWSELPVGVDRKAPLADLYPKEVIDELVDGLNTAKRWGVEEGALATASKIINSGVINQVTRRFIDGEIDADTAVEQINDGISGL